MAYQSWGPFQSYGEAIKQMVAALREEASGLKKNVVNSHMRYHEFYAERAGRFNQAADIVEAQSLQSVDIQGVLFGINISYHFIPSAEESALAIQGI